ncbi:MAG: DMT family transporter [Planctomycetes bacterium]|nr:DMT family transporter [Planctomycetota bacterium]
MSEARSADFSLAGVLRSGAWLSILFWAASFVATRSAIEVFHPFALVAARFALGSALLYGLLLARRERPLLAREDLPRGLLLGAILGAHICVQAFALLRTSCVHSGWIVGACPVVIAVGAQLFLGQRIAPLSWLGIGVAACGVLAIALEHSSALGQAGFGDLLVFGTTFSWAAYTLLSAAPVARSGALRTSAFAMGVASLVCAGAALLEGRALLGTPSLGNWLELGFLGACCSALAFWLWNRAIARFGMARLGALLYFQPFVTAGLALALGEERPGWNTWIGGPLVLSGVWLLGRGRPAGRAALARA